jgi:glycosyltransferase involved in cell wall biosynthesis
VTEIMPLVRAAVPTARLLVVGSNPTDKVRALAGAAVSVHANVSDAELQGFYARARATVVPLRYGAGVKLKVAEALREGVPLVTTPVGAQGCPGLQDIIAVCADPTGFAAAVTRLLTDDAHWVQCCTDQITYAREHFSPASMQAALLEII